MTTRSSLRRRLIASTALVGGAIAVPAMAQVTPMTLPDVAGITAITTQGLTAGVGTPAGAFAPVFTPGGTAANPTLGIALNDNRTIINYGGDGFNIGSAATVNFTDTRAGIVDATGATPNIAVLNRDISGVGSEINGTLTASPNIAVYILNTQGITFGTGANVNVGALIASSLELDATQDAAFSQRRGLAALHRRIDRYERYHRARRFAPHDFGSGRPGPVGPARGVCRCAGRHAGGAQRRGRSSRRPTSR